MKTPDDKDKPQVDDKTRERSAKQRNITAPTPPDVRDEGHERDDDNEPPNRSAEGP
ncbi:hypothetical protein [Streptomyces sp. NPDC002676]